MSEREPSYESKLSPELDPSQLKELSDKNHERMRKDAERAAEAQKNDLEAIHERIEHAARSKEEMAASNIETNANTSPLRASTNLKGHAYKRRLHSIQRQESGPERVFSKFIHNPVVESVSDAAEHTVARPSGLLFAGIFSALSGLIVLYICKHYGYEYNFTFALLAMAGGFVVGILLEGAWKIIRR